MHRQGIQFWARLEMILGRTNGSSVSRIIIVDIHDLKMAALRQESECQFERLLDEKRALAS